MSPGENQIRILLDTYLLGSKHPFDRLFLPSDPQRIVPFFRSLLSHRAHGAQPSQFLRSLLSHLAHCAHPSRFFRSFLSHLAHSAHPFQFSSFFLSHLAHSAHPSRFFISLLSVSHLAHGAHPFRSIISLLSSLDYSGRFSFRWNVAWLRCFLSFPLVIFFFLVGLSILLPV